jgi:hypothetical protein
MHLASADVLEKVRTQGHGFDLPAYALIPGCRINPSIFGDLLAFCEALDLPPPLFVQMPADPADPDPPLYTFKCQIGQLALTGELVQKRVHITIIYPPTTSKSK